MTINAALEYLRVKLDGATSAKESQATEQLIGWLEELRAYRAQNTFPVVYAESAVMSPFMVGKNGATYRVSPTMQNTCDGTPHCIHCSHVAAGNQE